VLPNKFVARAIITKLPHSWRDFATSLKHKRKEFTFDDLIATLDVEEKASVVWTSLGPLPRWVPGPTTVEKYSDRKL
jgi:hypothetical protein